MNKSWPSLSNLTARSSPPSAGVWPVLGGTPIARRLLRAGSARGRLRSPSAGQGLWRGGMEGNTHLLQVIRKMRSRINRLERENRALKGELQGCGQRAVPAERGAAGADGNGVRSLAMDGEGRAASPAPLQGSAAAAPAPSEQAGTERGCPCGGCRPGRALPRGRGMSCRPG